MKKLVLCLSLMLVSVMGVKAQGGYRGFLDVGPSLGGEGVSLDITTAHGYQFNKNWFIGAGIGVVNVKEARGEDGNLYREDSFSVPVFAKVRYDMLSEKLLTFFAEGNVGYGVYCDEGEPLYFSFLLGLRRSITERMGVNIGIGCSFVPHTEYGYHQICEDSSVLKFNIKVGVDF